MRCKFKIRKNSVNTFVMALMIFSATALWTSSTTMLYILITGLCAVYVLVQGINLGNLSAVITSRFFVILQLFF